MVQAARRRGVVLMNLGSPDSPSVRDVRTYLRQFLMDERVIDIPYISRFLLVNTIIAPFRAPRSAKLYKSIWTAEGSPLIAITKQLRDWLQKAREDDTIVISMRYGKPSVADAFRELEAAGVEDVILIPLYPHYAMSSYETAVADAKDVYNKGSFPFQIRFIEAYYDNEPFLQVLAASIRPSLKEDYDHVLFSYHGIPERHVKKSDPTGGHCLQSPDCCTTDSIAHKTCYRHQCRLTTTEMAARLGLRPETYSTSFQSRLGRDPWLQPYTAELLPKLPAMGIKKLVVVCPAFSADCLETLEEMDVEGKQLFLDAGGESFVRVPCLNSDARWAAVIGGWLDDIAAGRTDMIAQ